MLTNKITRILILLCCCFGAFFLSDELSAVKAQSASNSAQQTERKRPLTFKQIESLIKGSSTARPTPDNIIADEITERSVDFRIDDQMLTRLEETGAGTLTLNALRAIKGRVSKPGTTIILLANFKGLEPYGEDIGLTDILTDKLNEALADYPDVRVENLGDSITATHGGKQAALDAGREHNASIVLWGWFLKSSEKILVTINFEVMSSPHSLTISSERGDYNAKLDTLKEFTLQGFLSDELTTIILAATALTRMDVGDYWGAVNRFNEALRRRVSPQMVLGYDDIFLHSCWAYMQATLKDGPESVKKFMPQVVNNLEQFTKSHKDNLPAFHALGLAHIMIGKYDEALADGRMMLEIEKDPLLRFAAHQILFYAAGIKGDEKLEKEYANNIIKSAEGLDLPSAFEELRAQSYHVLGDEIHALESYERALKRDTSAEAQIRMRHAKASIYYDKSETWDQALIELKQITQLSPNDAEAYNLMGHIFYGREKFQEAVTNYQAAAQSDPRNAAYFDNLGGAYYALNDEKRAKANYDRALEIDPKNARAYFDRGALLFNLRNEKDALPDLEKSLTLESENVDALYKLAYIHLHASNFEAANADYERIVKIAPQDPDAPNLKGDISYWKKEYAAAADAYSKAIGLNPHIALYYDNRGNAYTQVGKTREALDDYKRAIKEDPEFENAYLDEGRLYDQLGQVKEALDILEECFKVDSAYVDALYNRAVIFFKDKNYDAAIAEYKRIIESYPKNANAFYYRGKVQAEKGNFFEAFADYGRAIKLQSDYAVVYLTRGLLYVTRGNKRSAIADFKKVLEISKDQNLRQKAEQQLKQLSVR